MYYSRDVEYVVRNCATQRLYELIVILIYSKPKFLATMSVNFCFSSFRTNRYIAGIYLCSLCIHSVLHSRSRNIYMYINILKRKGKTKKKKKRAYKRSKRTQHTIKCFNTRFSFSLLFVRFIYCCLRRKRTFLILFFLHFCSSFFSRFCCCCCR